MTTVSCGKQLHQLISQQQFILLMVKYFPSTILPFQMIFFYNRTLSRGKAPPKFS